MFLTFWKQNGFSFSPSVLVQPKTSNANSTKMALYQDNLWLSRHGQTTFLLQDVRIDQIVLSINVQKTSLPLQTSKTKMFNSWLFLYKQDKHINTMLSINCSSASCPCLFSCSVVSQTKINLYTFYFFCCNLNLPCIHAESSFINRFCRTADT